MKKSWIPLVILILVSSIIVFFTYKSILLHPNDYLFSDKGDAMKSYYNFCYYLRYDSGIKHDGINYPYGDHLQYINSHPLYSTILKFVDGNITPISKNGVGILNLTMILSLILSTPLLYLILRKFALPAWYAVITALLIIVLSPQLGRIGGHFEMVYSFFLPLFWYLLIRWKENKKPILWGSLLVISGLIGGFTSAYYAAFYSILLFSVLIIELWNNRKNLSAYYKTAIRLLIIAIIPVIVVKGLVGLTDWVDDRPNNPYGFYIYHANFYSIFLPFKPLITELFGGLNMRYEWEGRAFVGRPATILAISIFITFIVSFFIKSKKSMKVFFTNKKINSYLAASFLVLLFSMCIPFKYGFGFLLDILPPIRQFRALGRFSWIFYYVFTVFTAYYIYFLYRHLKLKGMYIISFLLVVFSLSIWALDANLNLRKSIYGIFNKNDKLEVSDVEYRSRFEYSKVDPNQFQAILSLPFTNTCGDKLLFEKGMNAFSEAMKCSYHMNIPLIQSFSPRLSFAQAFSSIQLLADSCIQKTRLEDMNEKPLLLVCTKEKLNGMENWIESEAKVFWEDKHVSLSILPVNVFQKSYQNWLHHVSQMIPNMYLNENIYTSDSTSSVIYNSFEEQVSDNCFSGSGALFKRRGEIEILNTTLSEEFNGEIELSFWTFLDTRTYDVTQADLYLVDNNNNKQIQRIKLNTKEVHNVYKQWERASITIDVKPGIRYRLVVKGKYIAIDDLLLRPIHTDIFVKESSLFNNFPVNLE